MTNSSIAATVAFAVGRRDACAALDTVDASRTAAGCCGRPTRRRRCESFDAITAFEKKENGLAI